VSNVAFFHIGANNRKSTEYVVKNIRSFYPDAPYHLGSDNAMDFSDIALENNTNYKHYDVKLGGPKQPYGWEIEGVLEFLSRFKDACILAQASNIDHVVMAEDDVILLRHVTPLPHWEMACHNIVGGNFIPPQVIKMIEEYSGKKITKFEYGGCGGSIFNAKTFLENYDSVTAWFKEHGHYIIHNLYPTFGWVDCFMVVYYHLCGKEYTTNPHLTDTHNHTIGFDYDGFISKLGEEIQIINNYKKYYYE
jgi:hypothetical protein